MMRLIGFVAVTALLGVVPAGTSPATGISYDEVVALKVSMGGDASNLQPGDFDSDFQTASQPKPPPMPGANFPAAGRGMAAVMVATRHYIDWPKERVDEPARQTASITDCSARTLTFLDLKNKTYAIGAMPMRPPTETENLHKVSLALTNRALGPRNIASIPTDGYQSNVAMGAPNGIYVGGRSVKYGGPSNMALTVYLAKMPQVPIVHLTCGRDVSLADFWSLIGFGETAYLMRALNGADPHFTVSNSGPALPNRFSMLTLILFTWTKNSQGSSGQGASSAVTLQRAHVAAIRSDDAIFQVPADFTKRL